MASLMIIMYGITIVYDTYAQILSQEVPLFENCLQSKILSYQCSDVLFAHLQNTMGWVGTMHTHHSHCRILYTCCIHTARTTCTYIHYTSLQYNATFLYLHKVWYRKPQSSIRNNISSSPIIFYPHHNHTNHTIGNKGHEAPENKTFDSTQSVQLHTINSIVHTNIIDTSHKCTYRDVRSYHLGK